jgi:adenylate cyclase
VNTAAAARHPRGSLLAAWAGLSRWLSSAELERLPEHVRATIAAQARANEILTGWVQAALVTAFAVLYAFSRKTFPVDAVFQPVPWALGIYAAFTVWRLYCAYRTGLTHALRMVSTAADIAVLMITIWSFHIQYGQPAAFYLKAPTVLYVFIFIALRALSLAPGYVLFAGIAAAAGWLVLLAYALAEPGGMGLITRDYVAYMTSARVLIGGEVDKVLSILIVAALLTAATARARTLLHCAVAEGAAAGRLARFFSPEVAATIVGAEEAALRPGEGRQTEAAAMFVDLRGFTRLAAELAPNELVKLLGEYQRAAVPVIRAHDGTVITYLGDGIMVTFGAVRASATYAADALAAAGALVDALEAWAAERRGRGLPAPGVGVGVDAGTVTCGAIGDAARLEFAVIGDPVNRAAKLQNHTKAESVRALASGTALRRAVEQGFAPSRPLEIRSRRAVGGIAAPTDVVVLR